MKIIAMLNSKGGVGKSTLGCALAAMLVSRGHRVLIIDLDGRQQSAYVWYQNAKELEIEDQIAPVMVMEHKDIETALPGCRAKYDVVILDTIGTTSGKEALKTFTDTLELADLVIIPVNPAAPLHLAATKRFDPAVIKALKDRPNKVVRYLMAKMSTRNTKLEMESLSDFLEDREALGLEVFGTVMYEREQYNKMAATGSSPARLRKTDPARKELEQLTDEVEVSLGLKIEEAEDA